MLTFKSAACVQSFFTITVNWEDIWKLTWNVHPYRLHNMHNLSEWFAIFRTFTLTHDESHAIGPTSFFYSIAINVMYWHAPQCTLYLCIHLISSLYAWRKGLYAKIFSSNLSWTYPASLWLQTMLDSLK